MANFAKLDSNNTVIDIMFVNNQELLDNDGVEQEAIGIAFCVMLTKHIYWRQTSYNKTFRKNFARVGSRYDPVLDAFIDPQPYPSWTLNATTGQWEPPTPRPPQPPDHYTNPGYMWDETTLSWTSCAYITDGTFVRPENS